MMALVGARGCGDEQGLKDTENNPRRVWMLYVLSMAATEKMVTMDTLGMAAGTFMMECDSSFFR